MANKAKIRQWARDLLAAPGQLVILDTETTGLKVGEVVQIALVDGSGAVLLDQLVKPSAPIPPGATQIHGITDAMVAGAPNWGEVALMVRAVLEGRDVVVYNAVYDRSMLYQSGERAGMERIAWRDLARWHCAMEQYAAWYGDWNEYHQSYRWQRLTQACQQLGLPEPDAPAHSALGDCLRTLGLLKALAASELSTEESAE